MKGEKVKKAVDSVRIEKKIVEIYGKKRNFF